MENVTVHILDSFVCLFGDFVGIRSHGMKITMKNHHLGNICCDFPRIKQANPGIPAHISGRHAKHRRTQRCPGTLVRNACVWEERPHGYARAPIGHLAAHSFNQLSWQSKGTFPRPTLARNKASKNGNQWLIVP